MTGTEVQKLKPGRISTGIRSLDRILCGGLPRGMITHIYGAPSSGKSSLAIQTIANMHKTDPDSFAVVANCEGYWSEAAMWYVTRFGVDPERLLLINRAYSEETLSIAKTLIKSNKVDLFLLDSVAGVKSSEELDKDMTDKEKIGAHARLVQRFTTDLVNLTQSYWDNEEKKVVANRTAIVYLNQLRSSPSQYVPDDTTGGRAVHYYSSVELRVSTPRSDFIMYPDSKKAVGEMMDSIHKQEQQDKLHIGKRVTYTVTKQRTGPTEGRSAQVDFYNRELPFPSPTGFTGFGFDNIGCIVDEAILHGVILVSGAWFKYDTHKVHGRDAFVNLVRTNDQLLKEILTDLDERQKTVN